MGFRLKPGRAVSSEIQRIVLRQLDIATSELKSIGDPESDEAIHDARRRVKKIRAVIRLVRPALNRAHAVDEDLGEITRMLAPVADGKGVLDTLSQLARRYHRVLPRKIVSTVRADLLERARQIDAKASAEHVLQRATATLRTERARVKRWRLSAEGFSAIAPGLKASIRRSRNAMIAAWVHPTPARHHAWRHHVKNHWFHVRLLEGRCGDRLMADQKRLEALDGLLGEYHNVSMLREVLATGSGLPRQDVTRCLRVLGRYRATLRRHAQLLGVRIYGEKPGRFVRRVKRFWQENAPLSEGKSEKAAKSERLR